MPAAGLSAAAVARVLAAHEDAYVRAALERFAAESSDLLTLLQRLAAAGLTTADPRVQAGLNAIVNAMLPGGEYHEAWLNSYVDLIGETVRVGGERVAASVGFDFSLSNPRVAVAVQDRAAQLATYVGQTSADGITTVIREAHAAGDGMRAIAARIRDEVYDGDITQARANLIARTETVGSLQQGEHLSALAAADDGALTRKVWRTQTDSRVRELHARLEGEERDMRDAFSNGLQYPGDPDGPPEQRIQCRCFCEYLP